MKILSGTELVGYIQERQARQVRGLRQAEGVFPKLVIIQTVDNPVIDTYVRMKKRYAEDILIDVLHEKVTEDEAVELIKQYNADQSVHGIIIQLPLADTARTAELVNLVKPEKDVDGLGSGAIYDPATPMAIQWLLAGYNVELRQKKVVLVGRGRLVGEPLARIWQASGIDVTVLDRSSGDLGPHLRDADVIVTATGVPGLITSDMIRPDTTVVDAATAGEKGSIVGDLADDVYERHDLKITPRKGGVGPLTVAALFDNVIRAARDSVEATTENNVT
ncbi:hypothetical protein B7Z28_00060 [Candidatus Saccharibacteria bacterium 32-45-3]|nr:MAG: hypothetical protein B7Z28_00060 [Candidatus Saccharibacteria bacterium 32-45-3]